MVELNILIIIFVTVIVIIYFNKRNSTDSAYNNAEHLTNLSNESLQTLSGVYNATQITANNVTATGTLAVAGTSTLSSNANVSGNLAVTGTSAFTGAVTTGALQSSTLTTTGNTTVGGALAVTGAMTGSNNLTLNGNLSVKGALYAPNAIPGAWMINGDGSFPIFGSMSKLGDGFYWAGDKDDAWIVLPGYKLVLWKDLYSGTTGTIDNTSGTTPMFKKSSELSLQNNTSSLKLYYGSTELPFL